jgi:hypothetical protein
MKVSASSTMAEGANGNRFKFIPYNNPTHWKSVAYQITDEEEQRLWEKTCNACDMNYNWQEFLEDDTATGKINEKPIFGPNHIKYDKGGLMSFALEKHPNDKWFFCLIRGIIWGWTLAISPDPENEWCSESCCRRVNEAKIAGRRYYNPEIDPQKSMEETEEMEIKP